MFFVPLFPCFWVKLFEQVQTSLLSFCLLELLLSYVSLDPVSVDHHQLTQKHTLVGGGLYSSCYCAFTHSYGPPCLSGASHTWKHPATTQHAPSFSHCRPAVSTNPTSYRTWPGAELASVNPGTAFQTKGTSNQIYVGLGLL